MDSLTVMRCVQENPGRWESGVLLVLNRSEGEPFPAIKRHIDAALSAGLIRHSNGRLYPVK